MPAKKTAARKPKAEPEPKGPEVEGFEVKDYEGMDLLVCERCGFDTFDLGSAKAHLKQHATDDQNAEELASLTENLSETAQVTTEGEADAEG